MEKVASSEVRKNMSEYLNKTAFGNERYVIHRSGKPQAALVSMDDLELLLAIEARTDIEEARENLREIDAAEEWEKVKDDIGL